MLWMGWGYATVRSGKAIQWLLRWTLSRALFFFLLFLRREPQTGDLEGASDEPRASTSFESER